MKRRGFLAGLAAAAVTPKATVLEAVKAAATPTLPLESMAMATPAPPITKYIFDPGLFVRLDGGTLDLGIKRDTSLAKNDLALFQESWVQMSTVDMKDRVSITRLAIASLPVGGSDGQKSNRGYSNSGSTESISPPIRLVSRYPVTWLAAIA